MKPRELWDAAHLCDALDMRITLQGNDQDPSTVIATLKTLGFEYPKPSKERMRADALDFFDMYEEQFNDCYCG